MTTTDREVIEGYRGYGVRVRPSLGARKPLTGPIPQIVADWIEWANQQLRQPFVGVTTDGTPIEGLFSLKSTGVSTRPIKDAADALLAALSDDQRAAIGYPVDAPEWRQWFNPDAHRLPAQRLSRCRRRISAHCYRRWRLGPQRLHQCPGPVGRSALAALS